MNQIQQLFFPIPYAIPEWVQVLDSIPKTLGFVETPELVSIREQLVEAIKQGQQGAETRKQLASNYIDLSNTIADRYKGEARQRAVLGIDITRAFIYLAGGDVDYFFEIMNEQVAVHLYEIENLPTVIVGARPMTLEGFLAKCMRTITDIIEGTHSES